MFIARSCSANGVGLVEPAGLLELLRDLDLGLPKDYAGALLPLGLSLAAHRLLELGRNDHVPHLDGLDGDTPLPDAAVDQNSLASTECDQPG